MKEYVLQTQRRKNKLASASQLDQVSSNDYLQPFFMQCIMELGLSILFLILGLKISNTQMSEIGAIA